MTAPTRKKPVKKKPAKPLPVEALMRDLETADFRARGRAEQKTQVEDWLDAALDIVGADANAWQRGNLAEAAGALLAGLYGLSLISMRLALTVDENADDPWYRVGDEFAGVTVDSLRQAVTASRGQPVGVHPLLRGVEN